MSWDDFLNPHEQSEYECGVCGKPMQEEIAAFFLLLLLL